MVEDDREISEMLEEFLIQEAFEVVPAFDGLEACEKFEDGEFDLVLLDLMIPKMSGMDVMKTIREKSVVPILIVSAKDSLLDKSLGLELGADDYITKPFSLMVLISKVQAFMRRKERSDTERTVLTAGGVTLDCKEMKVYVEGQEASLSRKEMQLLAHFLEHPKQIISKEQLLEAVWDVDGQFVDDNTVPVNISRLKKKLAGNGGDDYIKNIRGIGYLWTTDVLKK